MIDKIFNWFSHVVDLWDREAIKFTIYTTIAVLIGGIVELVPPFFLSRTITPIASIKPFNPLELAGRNIYQREGCNNCHTQMIRPFKWEVDRFDPQKAYGTEGYSKSGEYIYDHPFLWGSKRTGPDLAHESQINPSEEWHRLHLIDPRSKSPGSIMPAYAWLFDEDATIDAADIQNHMRGLATLGVPYSQEDIDSARYLLEGKTEGDALIAYLLKLGKDVAELEESVK